MEQNKPAKEKLGKKIRGQFMAGLLVIVPLGATILILVWLFNAIDNILQPVIEAIFKRDIPGVGFGVTIILIFLAGVVARNVIGRKILVWGDTLLNKVPIFKLVYRSIRQILTSFSVPDSTFMQVVLVDFPHPGMKALAFVTNEMTDKDGKKLYSVLIPTAPNPTSGFMEIVKEDDIIHTKITIDEAMKMVISAGRVMPEDIHQKIH
jgi:uncharacterized membrane protein